MEQIEHFIVLVMENRSFDHMLGYLDHPDPSFDGVGRLDDAITTMDSRYAIYPGPKHSHRAVMEQILGTTDWPSYPNDRFVPNMGGFVSSYAQRAPERSEKVLRCFNPQMLPVLSTLALEYAVCDRWFCSIPGETWPNRDMIHAGTSHGSVDIDGHPRTHNPPTIFRLLNTIDKSWRLYHKGIAHSLLYPQLFSNPRRRGSHTQLVNDIRNDALPAYAFVEPDYGLPGAGNSQHPSQARSREEFVNGEAFIADIYNALLERQDVFDKTAFIITYDEHGGFYDHVPPPEAFNPDNTIHRKGNYAFGFRILGPRVPAVVVSPWIPRGTVDHTEREHSCIAETVRKRFLSNVAMPLNDRAEGTDLGSLFSLDRPRQDLPELEALSHSAAFALEEELAAPPDESDLNPILDHDLQTAFQDLLREVRRAGILV